MKRWVKPQAMVEQFEANEYVAVACDGQTFGFVCDAGNKRSSYSVYLKDGTGVATPYRDTYLKKDYRSYSPCGETHTTTTKGDFQEGYMYKLNSGFFGDTEDRSEKIDVIIWTDNRTNCHCTTDLSIKDIVRS